MSQLIPARWRTQSKAKRRFYAKYMTWLERAGYFVVIMVIAAFLFAFNYQVNDVLKADGVKLEPVSKPIVANHPTLIIRQLVDDFSDVRQGENILEVIAGSEEILAYQAMTAATKLAASGQADLSVALSKLRQPSPTMIQATESGVFRASKATEIAVGEKLGEILDFSAIEVSSKFEGSTVSQAKQGDKVSFSNIILVGDSPTIFRGDTKGGSLISSQILGKTVQEAVSAQLKGRTVSLRNDLGLTADEVQSVEVDAEVDWSSQKAAAEATLLDPAREIAVGGVVVSGDHQAVIQITDMPADIQQRAEAAIRKEVQGKDVASTTGAISRIDDLTKIRVLLRVKAAGVSKQKSDLAGTAISRSYVAVVRITDPPAYLVNAMKAAMRQGKAVTARAELVTGARPIAFILLKKS